MRLRKSEEREIGGEGRREEAGRCRTDCNSIVQKTAGHKQTLTCSCPLALSFTLSSPYQPSVLPSSTQTLKTLSQIPIYSIRAEIYTDQWVSLSFPDTHTQTAVTTAARPPVSGPHEIFPGVRFPCFHGTGSTRLHLLYFTMETCNVMITVSFNPIGLTPYHLIKFSLMGEAVNIRIADVIMHSHSAFIARPTTDAHFLISCPHFLLFPFSPTWKRERKTTPV